MVPVPEYLKQNAVNVKSAKTDIAFSLMCDCGCKLFYLYENYLSEEERAEQERFSQELMKVIKPGRTYTITVDEDGTEHHWRVYWPFGRRKEVFPPKAPDFFCVSAIKAKCDACGKEHLLFDSRLHGYDAVVSHEEKAEVQLLFKKKNRAAQNIEVKIENDMSFEEFQENAGTEYGEAEHSEAFGHIAIYALNADGRRRKVFESETA